MCEQDTATDLQGIENWLNAHPTLLSLLQNTGHIASGVVWFKNLTPAGVVTGLVVNYGYEKLLQLMEDDIAVAQERGVVWFKNLTPAGVVVTKLVSQLWVRRALATDGG